MATVAGAVWESLSYCTCHTVTKMGWEDLARASTEIIVKSANMHWFRNSFSRLPSKHVDELVCDQNNFGAVFYRLKVGNKEFLSCSRFRAPKWGGRVKFGAHFGDVGKPVSDFPISAHWRYFDTSSCLLTNRPNMEQIVIFIGRVTNSALNKINRSRSHDIIKLLTPNETRGVDLSNEPRTNVVLSTVRLQLLCILYISSYSRPINIYYRKCMQRWRHLLNETATRTLIINSIGITIEFLTSISLSVWLLIA